MRISDWSSDVCSSDRYPTALWAIIRGAGVPGHQVGGRSPWSIIEEHDAHVARYLHSLDADQWSEIRREVEKARGRVNAQIFAAEVGTERRALDHKLARMRSSRGAAGRADWRGVGQECVS